MQRRHLLHGEPLQLCNRTSDCFVNIRAVFTARDEISCTQLTQHDMILPTSHIVVHKSQPTDLNSINRFESSTTKFNFIFHINKFIRTVQGSAVGS